MKFSILAAVIGLLLGTPQTARAESARQLGKADLVALTLAAPIIVRVQVDRTHRLSERLAPDVRAGLRRLLVRADVLNLLIAPQPIPKSIEYLVDMAADSRGHVLDDPKDRQMLLFLQPSNRDPDQFQLIKPWGQVPWTAERDAYVREIARAAIDPAQVDLRVTGIGHAFHVPGTLPGEAESQIFIETASGRPMSLVVLSRPGQDKTLNVATGDIIDAAAGTVAPGSLLWYQLACNLPDTLPEDSFEGTDPASTAALAEDYRFVRESIGRCDRVYGTEP